jgi:hypothetical protein
MELLMRLYLSLFILFSALKAYPTIIWQTSPTVQNNSRFWTYTIKDQKLILDQNDVLFTIPFAVIQSVGLSTKDFLDLIREYNTSSDKKMNIFVQMESDNRTIKSIDQIKADN